MKDFPFNLYREFFQTITELLCDFSDVLQKKKIKVSTGLDRLNFKIYQNIIAQ